MLLFSKIIFTLKKIRRVMKGQQTFNERITELVDIFGVKRLANYLGNDVDAALIDSWYDNDTLTETQAPYYVNFTALLFYYPQFNERWLKEGLSDMFTSGTKEENIKEIKNEEFKKKLAKDTEKIAENLK